MNKCQRYVRYYKTGIEQKANGVFPLVVWLAYSESRKNKLKQCIDECRGIAENRDIFIVILPDEFESLILNGAETLNKEGDGMT